MFVFFTMRNGVFAVCTNNSRPVFLNRGGFFVRGSRELRIYTRLKISSHHLHG